MDTRAEDARLPAVMDLQREKLLKALIALVTHYETPDALLPALTAMGRNHVRRRHDEPGRDRGGRRDQGEDGPDRRRLTAEKHGR